MVKLSVGAIRLTGPSRNHVGQLGVLCRAKLSIGEGKRVVDKTEETVGKGRSRELNKLC